MTAVALAGSAGNTALQADDAGAAFEVPVFTVDRLLALTGENLNAASGADTLAAAAAMLDAFLCVASICQVAADHLHRDVGDLRRIARYASRLPGPAGPAAATGLAAAARVARRLTAGEAALLGAWHAELEGIGADLADQLWGRQAGEHDPGALVTRWSHLPPAPAALPGGSLAIPPRCFFSFDQRPEDCLELAARFAARHPSDERGVLVVGVRTSGCFLAPIVAAGLERQGFGRVSWTSWRPGQPVLPHDRAHATRAIESGARVVVVDDPPTSGGSYARVAGDLVRAGIRSDRISLLVPALSDSGPWRDRLRRWETIALPLGEWRVQHLLSEPAVAEALGRLIPTGGVERVTRVAIDGDDAAPIRPSARKHLRARYRVLLREPDGSTRRRGVFVHGVGLGMFGAHVSRISSRLVGLVPQPYGTRDGLMFREWLPDDAQIDESGPAERQRLAVHVGRYAARREAGLGAATDSSLYMSGHDGLWERAGRWLGAGFGRLALPFRSMLHAAGRRLLIAERPSLIDGAMEPGRWFASGGAVLKTGWDEGPFVYQLPFTYDAAYDVAAAAAQRLPDRRFGATARSEFEAAAGRRVDDVRWFLHGILSQIDARDQALRESRRARVVDAVTEGERRIASLHRAFLCDLFLSDITAPRLGPLCAIDVDGVLESARAGYPAPSEAGVIAVRALAAHGMRGLIVTGRSIGESVERCRDYRLAGAVAEYGAAVYDATSGRIDVLLDEPAIEALARLRETLAQVDDVETDPAFEHSVRAFRVRDAARRAIPTVTAEAAIQSAGVEGRLRIVQGWAQTDFVPVGVDKGTGLRSLLSRLAPHTDPQLALAVGDSAPDLPMFELARVAVATANADPQLGLRRGVRRTRHPYGEGLAEAVEMMIGHRPGRCAICAVSSGARGDAELLLAFLRVGDRQGLRKLPAVARVIRLSRRRRL